MQVLHVHVLRAGAHGTNGAHLVERKDSEGYTVFDRAINKKGGCPLSPAREALIQHIFAACDEKVSKSLKEELRIFTHKVFAAITLQATIRGRHCRMDAHAKPQA